MNAFKEYARLLDNDSFLKEEQTATLTMGAVDGNAEALWLLSNEKRANEELLSSEILLFQAARKGCIDAQDALADAYFNGKFTAKSSYFNEQESYPFILDDTAAANWYICGYRNGSMHSTAQLGICYDYGIGVEQDLCNASRLLQAAKYQDSLETFGEAYVLDELIMKAAGSPIEVCDIPRKPKQYHTPVTEALKNITSLLETRERIKLQKESAKYIQWNKEASKSLDKLNAWLRKLSRGSVLQQILQVLLPVYWIVGVLSMFVNYFFYEKFEFINYLLYITCYPIAWILSLFTDDNEHPGIEDMGEYFYSFIASVIIAVLVFFILKGLWRLLKFILPKLFSHKMNNKLQLLMEQVEKNAESSAAPAIQKLDSALAQVEKKIQESLSQLPLEKHLKQESYICLLYEEALNHGYDSFKTLGDSFEKRLRDTQNALQEKNRLPMSRKRKLFKPVYWMASMGREEALKYFKGATVKKNIFIALECALNYISSQCPTGARGDGKHLADLAILYDTGKIGDVIVTPDPELSKLFRQGAIAVLRNAADNKRDPEAMYELYNVYDRWKDKENSLYWAQKAISYKYPPMLYEAASLPEYFSISESERLEYAKYAYEHGVKDADVLLNIIHMEQQRKAQFEQEVREFQRNQYNQEVNRRMEKYREKLDWAERDVNQFFSGSYLTNEERSILGETSDRDYAQNKRIREDLENRQQRRIEEEMKGE